VPWSRRVYGAVALGSALGAVARYVLSVAALHLAGPGLPWGTLTANVAGSLLIGFYATITGPDGRVLAAPATRQFVMAGLLGGFTTFSIFSLETVVMVAEGRAGSALAYVLISLVLWVPAAWAGHGAARYLNRLRRSEPPGGNDETV
jgi:fluoride exporter